MTTQIDPATPFIVKDTRTGKVVYRTTYKNRTRARRFADRKDLEYGAVRYVCQTESAAQAFGLSIF